ncbi:MAG: Verru_Chthon cassette protein A [Chthoniobacteraceae bacterium]
MIPFHSFQKKRGFALVVILVALVLLVGLVVLFLSRISVERSTAADYEASIWARQLADTTVSLVQGQINIASRQGSNVAWASQPGMVRTFDTSGSLVQAYKLYSAHDMISGSVSITGGASSDAPPSQWANNVALWTDLNAPVDADGTTVFPILDPSSSADGFTLTSAPGATAYQPAPMPVQWLYVLRDGSLVAPSDGSGKTATVPGDTLTNPIVGRIAFWTDDETCKVNINTASEGTYWDTPRTQTQIDQDLANYQPAHNEFQRYPGHPATTSLSTAFPTLDANTIYGLVPRIVGGGSNLGTVAATGTLTSDSDRLYASTDELIFKPNRDNNTGLSKTDLEYAKFFITAHSRAPETNLFNLPRIACWPIYKDVADERVSVFDKLIAFCASTGTSGTLNPYYFQREQYGSPSNDINVSRNQQLYSYLQTLTKKEIPGFGGNFLQKYQDDRDQILTEIFDYIRCTNLYDDTLAAGKQFTPDRNSGNSNDPINIGHGWAVPNHKGSGANTTMGFGRAYTLSELAIGFICNAFLSDSATPPASELQSSDTSKMKVLGGKSLNKGERYIQAIIIPEFFSPMHGWGPMRADMRIKISNLSSLTVSAGSTPATRLFPDGMDSFTIPYSDPLSHLYYGKRWGGNPGWQYFSLDDGGVTIKEAPPRGNLVGDVKETAANAYGLIGIPILLKPAGGTTAAPTQMTFSGGTLTFEFYAGATSTVTDETTLIQSLSINFPAGTFPVPKLVDVGTDPDPNFGVSTDPSTWWSFPRNISNTGSAGRFAYANKNPGNYKKTYYGCFFRQDYDTVRTVLPAHGDYRLVAASYTVPSNVFVKHPFYDDLSKQMASNLSNSGYSSFDQGFDLTGKYFQNLTYSDTMVPDIPSNAKNTTDYTPETTGDFDNALPGARDGPFINKPDEGVSGSAPYFSDDFSISPTFVTPNRQMPSPGMFGSLPTGVKSQTPWRTLLFRPQSGHFGATAPKDHLFLDLFWMPVVEPYAISDRFSTAGKINLNYQIVPFTYIQRSTGIRAMLKGEKVGAIPNTALNTYKRTPVTSDNFRKNINILEVTNQFDAKFNVGNVFKSASEICDIDIPPEGQTAAGMSAFWKNNLLTGDNMRERIYTTLYPRLTTKSNTYTVHFRTQALKKNQGATAGTWDESKGTVASEYRGSTTIERFIDANDPNIDDYAGDTIDPTTLKTLDQYYKWRVIANRRFVP